MTESGRLAFDLDAGFTTAYVGAAGNEGDVIVPDVEGREVFHFDGELPTLYLGAAGKGGSTVK